MKILCTYLSDFSQECKEHVAWFVDPEANKTPKPQAFVWENRNKLKSKLRTRLHLTTRDTLFTRNQWMSLMRLIYSQIHVTIFPAIAKQLHTPIKTNRTQNSSIRSDEEVTLETSAFHSISRF